MNLLANPILTALQKLVDDKVKVLVAYVFPVYFDLKHEAEMSYRVTSIPTTYFLDAEGNFVAQASGALDAATLQKGIDMLIE